MQEHIAFGIDGVAILLLLSSLVLSSRRSSGSALITGVASLALLIGSTIVRAYPEPTYRGLQENARGLTDQLKQSEAARRKLDDQRRRLEEDLTASKAKLNEREAEQAQLRASNSRLLQELLGGSLSIDSFSASRLSGALLSDQVGTAYSIRFRKRPVGDSFIFNDRLDILSHDEHAQLAAAVQRFGDLMVPMLDGAKSHRLFVRGGADARDFEEVGSPHEPFKYLQRDGLQLYEVAIPLEQTYAGIVRNEHLPDRRANYFSKLIAEKLRVPPPLILHNQPAATPDPIERAVELILVVEW